MTINEPEPHRTAGDHEVQRLSVLHAVCDTLVPPLDAPGVPRADRYFEQSASDRGLPDLVAPGLAEAAQHARAAVLALLDDLATTGFLDASHDARTELLHRAAQSAGGRFAVKQLKAMTFGLLVARIDDRGQNSDWPAIGYPGPASAPPAPEEAPKTIPLVAITAAELRLEADVCIVGSGAGGSVIAAELARAGKRVVVLEGGGYRNESDFRQLEAVGSRELYLYGGLMWSETGSLGLLAGATLGGGTVINSLACLRTPDGVRQEWARMGLDGVETSEFDVHTEAVWTRLGVNVEATRHNKNTQLMLRGLDALGMSHERMPRNASLNDDARFCGYCNAGCQQGCKQSTLRTYLQDAADAGARFLVDCRVDRIVTQDGRAVGVEARTQDGATSVTVTAPQVVVAAGSLESPAILLRSGIGGPAVGRHLRVHPTYVVSGVYDEVVNAWDGQIQSAVSFDMAHAGDEAGFLIETLGLSPAMWAGHSPWSDGRRHREALQALPYTAGWHAVCHDHGEGRVVLAPDGRPLVQWELDDPADRRMAGRAHVEMARLHHAAGAREIYTFHFDEQRWRHGEDFDAFLAGLETAPTHAVTAYSAHQMSSCRMGSDPDTSVADGRGELHDVAGVWVGDASALPTAPGVNPMISIMALAHRTAAAMLT